jgi:hypothetical protein
VSSTPSAISPPNPPRERGEPTAAVLPRQRVITARLRPYGRVRRRLGWALALAPVLVVLAADFLTRGSRIAALPPKYIASYTAAVIESGLLWASLMLVCGARRGAYRWFASLAFVVLFTAAVGGQLYFHSQYSTYLNLDATLFGTSFTGSVFGQVSADAKHFLQNVVPALLAAVVLVVIARKYLRPSRRSLWVARIVTPIAIVGVFLIPTSYRRVQASTPDMIYFHAMGGLIK